MQVEVFEPGTEIVPQTGSSLISLSAPIDEIVELGHAYQEVCKKLLEPSDIQVIGKKEFKKRSAWNKLSVAFGVSASLVSTIHERDDRGRIIRTECIVRATAPNGRTSDGLGACDLFERCCDPDTCDKWLVWPDSQKPTGHRHCETFPCRQSHFSNPQHDIPATAFTRASNRAKADLFGMGEVSAEEVTPSAQEVNTGPVRLSQETISRIGALFSAIGMGGPEKADERKALVVKTIGRTPPKIADLTPAEAADLVMALQEMEEPF